MRAVSYEEFHAAVDKAKLAIGPAELHGSVTGYLCAGRSARADRLLAELQLESDDAGVPDPLHALLDEQVTGISAELRAGGAVMPLLPEAPLPARANGMVDWCRGFLGGVGLAGVGAGGRLDPVARELLRDFGEIASTHLDCDDDDAALAAVVDYIRSGVLYLHAALAPAARG
jgi:uncharacterized protein YgfB (UPF0149 family)